MLPASNPFAMARHSAVPVLLVVVIEAAIASLTTLVPSFGSLGSATFSPWVLVAAPALLAAGGLGLLLLALERRRSRAAVPATLLVAIGLGTLSGALGSVMPSLRGLGLAFAAPLVVGEILAAGAWLVARDAERPATALSLCASAVTTCAAAFLAEGLDVEMSALAIGVGGVCAQLQLATARVGEGGLGAVNLAAAVGARFGAVPLRVVVAALGRSGPQGAP